MNIWIWRKQYEIVTLKFLQNPEKLDSRNKLIQNASVWRVIFCVFWFSHTFLISLMISKTFRHRKNAKDESNRIIGGILGLRITTWWVAIFMSLATDFAYPSIEVHKTLADENVPLFYVACQWIKNQIYHPPAVLAESRANGCSLKKHTSNILKRLNSLYDKSEKWIRKFL